MATKKLSPTGRRPRAEAVGESERPNTQALILDAAEQLFAAQGYGGTSIRQIAEAAGVNLGMFHYYWGSKQALCRAVLERRLGPIMAERMARLSSAVETNAPIEDLLLAAMEPSLRVAGAAAEQRDAFRSFYGRMLADPSPTCGKRWDRSWTGSPRTSCRSCIGVARTSTTRSSTGAWCFSLAPSSTPTTPTTGS